MKDGVSYPIDISVDDIAANRIVNRDIILNRIMDVVKVENILYDLNKYNVRSDAALILDRLVDMMKSNAEMKIEIRSHTDCRQDDNYNMKLSEKRAKSVVSYLTRQGISSSRLVAKGFGETMLINHCECEGDRSTSCSEEEQQVNRRTEFKILSLE